MFLPVHVYLVLHLDGFLILGLVQVNRLPYSWVESRGKAIGFMNNVGHSKAHGWLHLLWDEARLLSSWALVQVGHIT